MKCNHTLVEEMEWKYPNFWERLVGKKKKRISAGDGYMVCTKCGTRVLKIGGMVFSSESGSPTVVKGGL